MPPVTSSRRIRLVLVGLVLGVAGVAAGCGGDEEGGADTQETTQPSGGNERLTEEQWAEYTVAAETFVDARDTAEGRLGSCPGDEPGEFKACIGTTLDELESATRELESTLQSFGGTVSGECATSLGSLGAYANSYAATIATLQQAVDTGNAAAIPNARSTLQELSQGGRDEVLTFEAVCEPT